MPDVTRDFLQAFFPVPFAELGCERTPRLAVWSKTPKHGANPGKSRTDWATDLDQAAAFAAGRSPTEDVYFSVVLQDFDTLYANARHAFGDGYPASSVRGGNSTAAVLTALWLDLDVGTEGHRAKSYPPDDAAAL
ncbi:MAG: hypothetical protein V3T72_19535, partial [Thermoanaerobaculia bacterium]